MTLLMIGKKIKEIFKMCKDLLRIKLRFAGNNQILLGAILPYKDRPVLFLVVGKTDQLRLGGVFAQGIAGGGIIRQDTVASVVVDFILVENIGEILGQIEIQTQNIALIFFFLNNDFQFEVNRFAALTI